MFRPSKRTAVGGLASSCAVVSKPSLVSLSKGYATANNLRSQFPTSKTRYIKTHVVFPVVAVGSIGFIGISIKNHYTSTPPAVTDEVTQTKHDESFYSLPLKEDPSNYKRSAPRNVSVKRECTVGRFGWVKFKDSEEWRSFWNPGLLCDQVMEFEYDLETKDGTTYKVEVRAPLSLANDTVHNVFTKSRILSVDGVEVGTVSYPPIETFGNFGIGRWQHETDTAWKARQEVLQEERRRK